MTVTSSHSGKHLCSEMGLEGAMSEILLFLFDGDFYISKKLSFVQSESCVF